VGCDSNVCSTADSYIDLAVQGPGCVAEMTASRRDEIIMQLCGLTMISSRSRSRPWNRPINESATSFLYDSGRGISPVSGEDSEPQFLFQLISVATQRFNAVLCTTVFFVFRPPGLVLLQTLIFFINFSFLGNIPTEIKNSNNNNRISIAPYGRNSEALAAGWISIQ